MASYGFTLLYTMLSLLAGRVADTTHKGKTLALACSLWSGALILQGLCTSFYAALACRIVQPHAIREPLLIEHVRHPGLCDGVHRPPGERKARVWMGRVWIGWMGG
eukprot:226918-Rhodomonas_salina.4